MTQRNTISKPVFKSSEISRTVDYVNISAVDSPDINKLQKILFS